MTINRRDENGNNHERNAANSSERKIPSCIVYDCSRDMEGAFWSPNSNEIYPGTCDHHKMMDITEVDLETIPPDILPRTKDRLLSAPGDSNSFSAWDEEIDISYDKVMAHLRCSFNRSQNRPHSVVVAFEHSTRDEILIAISRE